MITIDSYLFGAICCEAAFGLGVTLAILYQLFKGLIFGWGDEEQKPSEALKPPKDSRLGPE